MQLISRLVFLWLWDVKVSYGSFPPAYLLLCSLSTLYSSKWLQSISSLTYPLQPSQSSYYVTFIRYNCLNCLFYCFFILDGKLKVRDPGLQFRVLFVSLFYFPAALLSQNTCTQNTFFWSWNLDDWLTNLHICLLVQVIEKLQAYSWNYFCRIGKGPLKIFWMFC